MTLFYKNGAVEIYQLQNGLTGVLIFDYRNATYKVIVRQNTKILIKRSRCDRNTGIMIIAMYE